MPQPVLSLLFPLYRSAPFFENLVQQIEQLSNPLYEIIVSDRNCYDNTVDRLQEKFKTDGRFKFIKATDNLDWVSHYNTLLQLATGKYFCWVPHDDSYSPDYFSLLINKMEEQDAAIVAFATMNVQGTEWKIDYEIFKKDYQYPFTSKQYINFWNSGLLGIPFRGIFRRAPIVERKIWIRQNKNVKAFQDLFWIFALLLNGDFIYTEQTSSTKNFIKGSAHSAWNIKALSKRNPNTLKFLYDYIHSSSLPLNIKIKLSVEILTSSIFKKLFRK